MNTITETGHGTGGLPSKLDLRDHSLGKAAIPFNWQSGYDIETILGYPLLTEDQGTSSSCGGQALRYYLEVLLSLRTKTFTRLSAKDGYSQIFYKNGGTTTRDIGNLGSNKGITPEALIASYNNGNPPDEPFMEQRLQTPQTVSQAVLSEEFGYAWPNIDIDSVAQAIRDNHGAIGLIHGIDNGTWLSAYPIAPTQNNGGWNHFLYFGKAVLVNGKKYIAAKNSWGNVGENGWQWLGEDYFKGQVKEVIVFYDKTLYTPTPTSTPLNWIQKFMQWFFNFQSKLPLS